MAFNKIPYHFIVCFFLFLSFVQGEKQLVAEVSRTKIGLKSKKLFVFGDSFADTGNIPISSNCWKFPYGITFPGKPTGRCSDGRIFTDYFAKSLGIKTPIAYRWRKFVRGRSELKAGMNFAVGGTGVFQTVYINGPNMTTQIDRFQAVLASGAYTKSDLKSSVAQVSVTGNDHTSYIMRNGSPQGFPSFIKKLIDQVEINLKLVHGLGVKKVAVTALQPIGCLPKYMVKNDQSTQECNATLNALSQLHNKYLQQVVSKLNRESNVTSFFILDFNEAFWTLFKQNQVQGYSPFPHPYKQCCRGKIPEATCGSVDSHGTKMYTVCGDPSSSFFWDGIHVSQMGWKAVTYTPVIQATLKQL